VNGTVERAHNVTRRHLQVHDPCHPSGAIHDYNYECCMGSLQLYTQLSHFSISNFQRTNYYVLHTTMFHET